MLVTLIATIGVLPYIALQLKAVAMSYSLLTTGYLEADVTSVPVTRDPAWYSAMLMVLFTILFGTRHLDATEHHQGMVHAVAFESLIKLMAFCAVGLFVCFYLFDGVRRHPDPGPRAGWADEFQLEQLQHDEFCDPDHCGHVRHHLPARQFHVTIVENTHVRDLNYARVIMPVLSASCQRICASYSRCGNDSVPFGEVNTDAFVLKLPMIHDQTLADDICLYWGGSAATAMVIVSSVTMSTMICNEIIVPGLLTLFSKQLKNRKI